MMQNSIVVLQNDAFVIRNVSKLPKEIESGQTRLSKTCPRKQIIREQIVVLFLLDWCSTDCWVNFDYVFDVSCICVCIRWFHGPDETRHEAEFGRKATGKYLFSFTGYWGSALKEFHEDG